MTKYLQKHAFLPPQIMETPAPDLSMVIVIPCHDEPDAVSSLQALRNCAAPPGSVEVIIVINSSEVASDTVKTRNAETLKAVEEWIREYTDARFRCFALYHPDLPKKHAGVGLARKVGMDEAVRRLEMAGNPQGVIACFDADSNCDTNYLQAIESHFKNNPDSSACSIYYEHPTQGTDFPKEVYSSIIQYELYLRYYVHALRFSGFPHAYQTIGSSMAVRADAYQRQGGMNRRKAGEDFYFLHKFIPLGNFTELKTTRVIPSPRPSHRVPFGTGKAIQDMLDAQSRYMAYHPNVFKDLKVFLEQVSDFYTLNEVDLSDRINSLPDSIRTFLLQYNFYNKWAEIKRNTANLTSFEQRFFRWFNAFIILKYVHDARDRYYPSIPVQEAASWLANKEGSELELLESFRQRDRS